MIVTRPSLTPSRTTSHTSRGTDSAPPRRRQVFEAAASTGGDGARAATSAAPRTPGTPSSRAARWPPPAAAPPLRTTRGEGSDSTQPARGRRKEGARARCGARGVSPQLQLPLGAAGPRRRGQVLDGRGETATWQGGAVAPVRGCVSQAIGPSSRLRRLQFSPRPRAPTAEARRGPYGALAYFMAQGLGALTVLLPWCIGSARTCSITWLLSCAELGL